MCRVMVWGGTRGLGRELARASLARGNRTAVAGRTRPEDLEEGLRFTHADFSKIDPRDTDTPRECVNGDFWGASLNANILFWVAGHWLRKPFQECTPAEIQNLFNVHLVVPSLHLRQLLEIHARAGSHRQLHLVTIASSSAWKTRGDGQTVYGAVQAAKVQFARNLHAESGILAASTIVRPGGMKTDFFNGSEVDSTSFADPREVATKIWDYIDGWRPTPIIEIDIAQIRGHLKVRSFNREGDPWVFESYNQTH